jgi:hypothetical protein
MINRIVAVLTAYIDSKMPAALEEAENAPRQMSWLEKRLMNFLMPKRD